MKALFVRISVGIIALGTLLYFLACNPPTQNNNTSQNQNQAKETSAPTDLTPCAYGSEPGSHAKHIKDEIVSKMGTSLKKLLKDQNNPNGTFTLEIQKATNGTYFIANVKGKLSG